MKKTFLFTISILLATAAFTQVWQKVNINTSLKLNSVSFGSEMVGYIGANDSTLFKTFDGGYTWAELPTQGFNFSDRLPDITHLEFITADTGFAMLGLAPYDGLMYKTTDGGVTWVPQMANMCSPVFSYHFDTQNGFIIGSTCFGGKTIDKKVNDSLVGTSYLSWAPQYLRTIDFYNFDYGMAAGDSGEVHRTFDGGSTWDTVETITNEIIWDLQFVNDSVIYAVIDSSSNSLMISIDSGATWNPHHNSLTFLYPQFKGLVGMKNESIIAVGAASQAHIGAILWGSEHSTFWGIETTPQILNNVGRVNDSIAVAVGDSGLIMANFGIINSIHPVPEKSTVQVFPNPSSQHISVQTSQTVVDITILDVVGKVVFTGTETQQIPVSHLNSGMYYVVVRTVTRKEVVSFIKE